MASSITRIEDTGIIAQLTRIAASGLLQKGCVNTIELNAIQRGLGDKWLRRREQVWEHVGNTVEANIGAANFCIRLTETSFLICITGCDAVVAQAQCARILRDLLSFFIGSSAHADIIVRNVTSVEGGQITTAPVALRSDMLTEKRASEAKPVESTAADSLPRSPVVVNTCGGPLSISLTVERVFSLADSAFAARRIKVGITDVQTQTEITSVRMQQLETAALTRIDQHTAAFARRLLSDPAHVNQAVLMPVSIQSVGNTRGRGLVLENFKRDIEQARRRLVIEMVNLTAGTPVSRIAEVVSLLRTSVRAVLGRFDITSCEVQSFGGSGLMGFVVELGSSSNLGVDLVTKFLGLSEIARNVAPTLIVGPLPTDGFTDVCRVAGATHVSFLAPLPLVSTSSAGPPAEGQGGSHGYHHIIYASRARIGPDTDLNETLQSIIAVSMARNRAAYVTGLLLYYGGWFVQILEGRRAAVGAIMERIFKDERHDRIEIIHAGAISEREFARWNMAGLTLPDGHQDILDALPADNRLDLGKIAHGEALALLRIVARLKTEEEETQTNSASTGNTVKASAPLQSPARQAG